MGCVFRNSVLLSSSDGKQRTLPIACVLLGLFRGSLSKNSNGGVPYLHVPAAGFFGFKHYNLWANTQISYAPWQRYLYISVYNGYIHKAKK